MISVLLFDLDGTLVDSVPDLQAALNRLLAEHGRPPLAREAVSAMVGDGTAKLVERGLAASGLAALDHGAALARFMALYEADAVTLTRPYPGVAAGLALLRDAGWRLGVCTNKPESATARVLEGLRLDGFFGTVIGGDSLAVRKPDPGPLLAALERLGGEAAHAAMVGDHANDLLAGRAAGLKVVLARWGYGGGPLDRLTPDAAIDRFAELPWALKAIGLA